MIYIYMVSRYLIYMYIHFVDTCFNIHKNSSVIKFLFLFLALNEAQDINLHLKPLRFHFEDLEQADFDTIEKMLPPMMHVICLIWANSKYYNTPTRIVVLLQEVCNLLIEMVSSFFIHCLILEYLGLEVKLVSY